MLETTSVQRWHGSSVTKFNAGNSCGMRPLASAPNWKQSALLRLLGEAPAPTHDNPQSGLPPGSLLPGLAWASPPPPADQPALSSAGGPFL